MLFAVRHVVCAVILAALTVPALAAAQTPTAGAKLTITVSDPSGAIVPGAAVTIVGLEGAGKGLDIAPAKTAANGSATFEGLVPLGRMLR